MTRKPYAPGLVLLLVVVLAVHRFSAMIRRRLVY